MAGGRKFLDAAGHVDDVEIVLPIKSDGARLIEFANACTAAADDFDSGKEFGFERRLLFVAADDENDNKGEADVGAHVHMSNMPIMKQVENALCKCFSPPVVFRHRAAKDRYGRQGSRWLEKMAPGFQWRTVRLRVV